MLIFCHVDVPYFAGSIAQCLCDLVYCIFSSYFNEVFYLSKKKKSEYFFAFTCAVSGEWLLASAMLQLTSILFIFPHKNLNFSMIIRSG